jgi:hypothetical protein
MQFGIFMFVFDKNKHKWTSNYIWFTCSNCGIVGDFNMTLNLDKSEHCCVGIVHSKLRKCPSIMFYIMCKIARITHFVCIFTTLFRRKAPFYPQFNVFYYYIWEKLRYYIHNTHFTLNKSLSVMHLYFCKHL